jgi:hypothetical protein
MDAQATIRAGFGVGVGVELVVGTDMLSHNATGAHMLSGAGARAAVARWAHAATGSMATLKW